MGAGHHRVGTQLAPRICSKWREKGSRGQGPGSGGRPEKVQGSPRGTGLEERAPGEHVKLAATPLP